MIELANKIVIGYACEKGNLNEIVNNSVNEKIFLSDETTTK